MSDDIYYKVAHRNQEELDSFKTRYADFDTSLIPKIFKDSLDVNAKDFKRSNSQGSSHVIYFVSVEGKDEPLVLRANLGVSKPEVVMLTEKLVTDKLQKMKIPTNKIIYVDVSRDKFDFDFQIHEKVKGEVIEDNFDGTKKEYDKISYDLGAYIARYSDLKFDKFGLFDEKATLDGKLIGTKDTFYSYISTKLEDDLKYLGKSEFLSTQKIDQIIKIFEKFKDVININQGGLVHHDLADHNIFYKNDKITGIFDWEAFVIGDVVLDLASCPTWSTIYPREKVLLEGYKSVKSLPDNYQEKRNIYRLRTILWKTVYAKRRDRLDEKYFNRFRDALKLFKI